MADVLVLDAEAVEENAAFRDPHRYATGLRHVPVSRVPVLRDPAVTGARPGHALRHRAR